MNLQRQRHTTIISGVIVIIIGIIGCSCNRRPKGVLSDNKMVEVITDLQLAEAYSYNQINGTNTTEEREKLSMAVLESHNVTKEELDTTLGWYGRNMDLYSKLYEKVDKRLLEKRKKLLEEDNIDSRRNEADNLWPYSKNGLISTLGNSDGWRISIPNPDLTKGDRLEWSMHLNSTFIPLIGVLGVDYEDGTSEALTTFFNNRQNLDFSFQTDTSKIVRRIFGSMRVKNTSNLPLFADSIALRRLPFDSLEFTKFRAQRKYSIPVRIDKNKEKETGKDKEEGIDENKETETTFKTDTLKKNDKTFKHPVPLPSKSRPHMPIKEMTVDEKKI